jgi:hypothetical protein
MFDRTLSDPATTGQRAVIEWVSVIFGYMELDHLAEINLDLILCTRQDPEGYKLAQLRDKVVGYLIDTTQTDGMTRVPFYRTYPSPWELLGALVIQSVGPESAQIIQDDETKYKIVPIRLRWGAKV